MICPKCGKEAGESKYCDSCGHFFSSSNDFENAYIVENLKGDFELPDSSTQLFFSEKIILNKQIVISYIIILVFFVAWVLSMIGGWAIYSGRQKKCAEIMRIAFNETNTYVSDEYDSLIEKSYETLKPYDPITYYYNDKFGDYYNANMKQAVDDYNSSISSSKNKLRKTCFASFKSVCNYPNSWDVCYVFCAKNFGEYFCGMFSWSIYSSIIPETPILLNYILISLFAVSLLLSLLLHLINYKTKDQKIIIDDNKAKCILNNKKTIDFPFSRLTTVKRESFKSVNLISPGNKAKVILLKNQVDIVNLIIDKMNQAQKTIYIQNDQSVTSVQNDKSDNDLESLLKLKQLFETGVITQEEYDAKKKQILGL